MADNKIKTSELPDAKEAGVPKTLQPGNQVIKVNGISIKKVPFEGDPVEIILSCEGEPVGGDFEGFAYDKDKPELGNALGPVGQVRAQEYSFKDGVAGKKQLNKVEDIKMWLVNFFKAMDKVEWLRGQGDFDSVEELIAHIDTHKPFKDVWFNSCLAGKGYINNKGFLNYELFLTWFNNHSVPLELVGTVPSKLAKFSKDLHIKAPKKKAPSVEGFEGKKSSDFDI